jgi:hypothetical protein
MKIATTINIRKDLLARLIETAEISGSSPQDLVSSLLGKYMVDDRVKHSAFERVRYQQRRERSQWKRLHVSMRCDEYEYCIDLRKVCKMSVSFLVACAIERYLDELLVKCSKNADSYHYHNYAIMNIKIENVSCWVIYWGIPPRLLA